MTVNSILRCAHLDASTTYLSDKQKSTNITYFANLVQLKEGIKNYKSKLRHYFYLKTFLSSCIAHLTSSLRFSMLQ